MPVSIDHALHRRKLINERDRLLPEILGLECKNQAFYIGITVNVNGYVFGRPFSLQKAKHGRIVQFAMAFQHQFIIGKSLYRAVEPRFESDLWGEQQYIFQMAVAGDDDLLSGRNDDIASKFLPSQYYDRAINNPAGGSEGVEKGIVVEAVVVADQVKTPKNCADLGGA